MDSGPHREVKRKGQVYVPIESGLDIWTLRQVSLELESIELLR